MTAIRVVPRGLDSYVLVMTLPYAWPHLRADFVRYLGYVQATIVLGMRV